MVRARGLAQAPSVSGLPASSQYSLRGGTATCAAPSDIASRNSMTVQWRN